MRQHQHLRVFDLAKCNAEEIADANVDGHAHAADGTAQHHPLAMKFDLPDAAILLPAGARGPARQIL